MYSSPVSYTKPNLSKVCALLDPRRLPAASQTVSASRRRGGGVHIHVAGNLQVAGGGGGGGLGLN